VAKPDMASRSQEEVENEYRQRLVRLAARKSRGRGASPSVPH
jgi:hypothetical protein